MPWRAPSLLLGALLALAALAVPAPRAAAAAGLSFASCPDSREFSCAELAVPLDRSGRLPGTVQLSVERRLSGALPSQDAVVALAGGPGQATLPLASFIVKAIAPALSRHDLLLFDQRGTGASDPLHCGALEEANLGSIGQLYEQCALDIGPARGDFTTAESVEDLEALRRAGGYERLVIYATSYGTKVALDYAERYPHEVEALVLDSVVPATGKEPLQLSTFQAIKPMLEELCSGGVCAGITANPTADLARLAARLRRQSLAGSVYDGDGHRHAATLTEPDLFSILLAGDLNPALRALLPAALRSALTHDPDPLLRLELLSEGLIPSLPSTAAQAEPASDVDEALFATTTCEETPFPWQRGASAATRLAEARAALDAQPASAFYPFDASTAWVTSPIPACAQWPDASAAPPSFGALPEVPTLVLSGGQDLRTPTAGARALAAQIPGSQLVVVPYTGHSVLGSDLSGCAARAVTAFFAGAAVEACAGASDRFAPTPITPTRLSAVHPPVGLGGRDGQTLVAVLDTLVDLNRQVIGATLQANRELPTGSSFGGLRGGYARLTGTAVVLRHFAFVPGVALTGTFPVRGGQLQAATIQISGSEAARGEVRVSSDFKQATGTLAGRHFSIAVAKAKLSRAGAGEWPADAVHPRF